MKRYSFTILAMALTVFLSAQNRVLNLWPDVVPNNLKTDIPEGSRQQDGIVSHVFDVTTPTLTVYPAKLSDSRKTPVVIICPGGGYANLSIKKEGHDVAAFLADNGITGIVLKYRLPKDQMQSNKSEVPLLDAQQAISLVRKMADELNILPDKIGIMGFSAGGHLAATVSTRKESRVGNASNVRPDFSILIYPVISMKPGTTHMGSHNNLLGEKANMELEVEYSNELHIDRNTPPTFMVHSFDDKAVPIENTFRYLQNLKDHGVECEAHLFKSGGHGYGMLPGHTDSWPGLMLAWLKTLK
jgi:acetyl esterase/lipase